MTLNPEVDHVHGAVVHDGDLLLGTHSGLVAVDLTTGQTQPRGTARDDLMGLASDGTGIVASGHPGPDSPIPDPMGLMRSPDNGLSWESVSLAGEVDFHGLVVDGGNIAGFGTADGVLVSSDDGLSWSALGVEDATSLAWFQGTLWIAGEAGIRIWSDGTVVNGPSTEPPMILLAAASDARALWGVSRDGVVWRTSDGRTWVEHGAVNAVEALAATTDAAYAVTAQSVRVIQAQ